MRQLSRLPPRSVLLSLRSEVATGNPHPHEGAQVVSCYFSYEIILLIAFSKIEKDKCFIILHHEEAQTDSS